SRRHAVIEVDAAGASLRDLDSANGTYVNDRRVEGEMRLKRGDYIRLGRAGPCLRIVLLDPSEDAERRPPGGPPPAPPHPGPGPPGAPVLLPAQAAVGRRGAASPPARGPSHTRLLLGHMARRQRWLWLGLSTVLGCLVVAACWIFFVQGTAIGDA